MLGWMLLAAVSCAPSGDAPAVEAEQRWLGVFSAPGGTDIVVWPGEPSVSVREDYESLRYETRPTTHLDWGIERISDCAGKWLSQDFICGNDAMMSRACFGELVLQDRARAVNDVRKRAGEIPERAQDLLLWPSLAEMHAALVEVGLLDGAVHPSRAIIPLGLLYEAGLYNTVSTNEAPERQLSALTRLAERSGGRWASAVDATEQRPTLHVWHDGVHYSALPGARDSLLFVGISLVNHALERGGSALRLRQLHRDDNLYGVLLATPGALARGWQAGLLPSFSLWPRHHRSASRRETATAGTHNHIVDPDLNSSAGLPPRACDPSRSQKRTSDAAAIGAVIDTDASGGSSSRTR